MKKLWYEQEAEVFEQALPIGNGRLGGMVYGGAKKEKISLNDDTLWSGFPKSKPANNPLEGYNEAKKLYKKGEISKAEETIWKDCLSEWSEAYLPAGNLFVEFSEVDKVTEYYRELNISNAVATTGYTYNGYTYSREAFCSKPQNVMILKFKTNNPDSVATVQLESPHINKRLVEDDVMVLHALAPSFAAPNYFECEEPIVYDAFDDNRALTYAVAVKPVLKRGSYAINNDRLIISSNEFELYLAIKTNYEGYDKQPQDSKIDVVSVCIDDAILAAKKGYNECKMDHLVDYQALFNRVELFLAGEDKDELPTDKRLCTYVDDKSDTGLPVLFFDYARYLTIAGSRCGTQPTNLQGIWNEHLRAPWSSNYTININAQMNYWHAEACNLSECHIPLIKMIGELAQRGEQTAKESYGYRGWCSHHNTDIWRQTEPVGGLNGDGGAVTYGFWNGSGAWLTHHVWEHYEYTKSLEFLEKYWFVIKGAALFAIDRLESDADGVLHTPISTSPENSYVCGQKHHCLSEDCAMDIGITADIFTIFLKAAAELNCEPELVSQVNSALARLVKYKIGSKGQILEWCEENEEGDPHHRHLSLLYGLYPGTYINDSTPELLEACKQTMLLRSNEATGWGIAWKINVWARLCDGENAKICLDKALRPVVSEGCNYAGGGGVYPNMFDAHPPFQIDGNFGSTAGIVEMLLQNKDGKTVLLPALPKAWSTGNVRGLKIRGGKTISFAWKDSKVTTYEEI